MISLHHIVKEMLAEKTRLCLTILAIAWGTASIAGMLAVGEGLRTTFGHAMSSVGKGLLVVKPGTSSKSYHGSGKGKTVLLTTKDLKDIQASLKGARVVSAEYAFSLDISHGKKHSFVVPNAVYPIYGAIRSLVPERGRFINPIDLKTRQRVIFLGNKVAEQLFKPGVNPVGKTILLGKWSFLVIGVMKQKLQFASYGNGPDAYHAWIPATTFQALSSHDDSYNDFVILPQHPNLVPSIEMQVRHIIADNQGFDPTDDALLNFRDLSQIQKTTDNLFFGMQIFLGLVGSITLMIAGIGIANVMYVSVTRATRDIGVRMAIGARTYHILLHYISECFIATIIGGILGLLFVKAAITGFGTIPIKAELYTILGSPKPILSFGVILAVMIVLGLIGLLAALFPAYKAANIDPAVALRTE